MYETSLLKLLSFHAIAITPFYGIFMEYLWSINETSIIQKPLTILWFIRIRPTGETNLNTTNSNYLNLKGVFRICGRKCVKNVFYRTIGFLIPKI